MEFYDKFVDRFHLRHIKSKESCCQQSKGLAITYRAFKRKCFGGYDAVTLVMFYLKALHDMVSQNS